MKIQRSRWNKANPKATRGESRSRAPRIAQRGWKSRRVSLLPVEGKVFFLTFPFREQAFALISSMGTKLPLSARNLLVLRGQCKRRGHNPGIAEACQKLLALPAGDEKQRRIRGTLVLVRRAQSWSGMDGIENPVFLRHHSRGCSHMTTIAPTIQNIVAELDILTNKLKCTTDEDQRRTLLKQFRALLDGADRLAARYPPTE
jgi:hypothetical protein